LPPPARARKPRQREQGGARGRGHRVYVIVRTGAPPSSVLSRVSKRRAVWAPASLPRTSHPKLPPGLSTHACTSATSAAVEPHVYAPGLPTESEALGAAVK